ncbi:MAG: hypothetical protein NZM40_01385 [Sphingomonadaceae bacterium]|uniref:hypothetical protein n=1 Tax=Thermaurantiacus sp. TaxID=2820283 RepID=UPI00298F015F|nr:hypothetical protein [Thermaurantiacus sp.]MCS6986095.1 hypothetical protein [Sphingomonadaceae bacterium]MDW8414689.1 hypothetical protein [Thermaurantiacus sp.]
MRRAKVAKGRRTTAAAALTVTVLAAGPGVAVAQETPSAEPPPPTADPRARRPGEPLNPPAPATPAPVEPVGPVRTFEPVPLPGAEAPAAPVVPTPARPAAPVLSGVERPLTPSPVVPGAAEAGYVVPDARGLYGEELDFEAATLLAAAGFRASASLDAEYNSNVAWNRRGQPLPPGSDDSRDDWIFRPALRLGLGRELGRQLLYLNSVIGRSFFLRNEERGRANASVAGGLAWRLGASCEGRLQGAWATRETSFEEFLEGVPSSTRTTSVTFGGACNSGAGLVPSFNLAAGNVRVTPDERSVADRDFWSAGGALGYQFTPRLQAGVQGAFQRATFPNQRLVPGGDPIWIETVSVAGFASLQVATALSVSGALGWSQSDSANPAIPGFSGLTGNLSLALSQPRYGLSLDVGRGLNLGRAGGANLRVRTNMALNGVYQLSPNLDLQAGVAYARNDNRGDPTLADPLDLAEFRTFRAFAGVGYRLSDRIRLGLTYRYRSRLDEEAVVGGVLTRIEGFGSHAGILGIDIRLW